jgi:uncharacterized ParB-like nuclease family protein
MSSTLPKLGQKVWAWSPQYKKELPITVTHIKGNKFWGDDNQLNRHTGLQRWRPAEDKPKTQKGEKLKGDQLFLIEDEAPVSDVPVEVPVEIDPSKNFGGIQEIKISEIWPIEEDFEEENEEAKLLQPREGIDSDTVERYMEVFDALPPVDVFVIEGKPGYCLAGGWHRRAAAEKLGRETIKAKVHQGSWEEAVSFACTDNLQCGLQLGRDELEAACKNFLKIAKSLPASKIEQIVSDVNRKFKKQSTELSNVVIGLMFGLSDRTIANYKKDLELEELRKSFQVGMRVETSEPSDMPAIYRRGFIQKNDWRIEIKFDFAPHRSPQSFADPTNVKLCSEPIANVTVPSAAEVGDIVSHWKTGRLGIVASTKWENPDYIWGIHNPSSIDPVVLWDDEQLEIAHAYNLDIIDKKDPPTLDECILITRRELATIEGEDKYSEYEHKRYLNRLRYLESLLAPAPPEPAPTEPMPAPAPAVTTEQETQQLGQSLGLNGKSAQVLPDHPRNEYIGMESNANGNGKYPPSKVPTIRFSIQQLKQEIEGLRPTEEEALEILQALLPSLPGDFQEQFEMLIEEEGLFV